MARSSTSFGNKWKAGNTMVTRIPEVHAPHLIRVARFIDEHGDEALKEMEALMARWAKLAPINRSEPVNVSSVPQRSPFRYPGGKTWFVPYLRAWMQSRSTPPARLIEPFAGGAIVSLTAGFERLARHVIFCEKDPDVSAVWRVLLNGESEWLASKILGYDLTITNVQRTLASNPRSVRELAFRAILKNRVQRGGIMAEGAGLVKSGENGKGIMSRWYPETLATRIREINAMKDRFTFIEGDGFDLISEHAADKESAFYIDPPYTTAAKRLYTHWAIDHEQLFKRLSKIKGDFLMSYDNTAEVLALAKQYGFETRPISMKNTHHATMDEVIIGKDLAWVR